MNTEAIAVKLENQLLAAGRVGSGDPAAEQIVEAMVTSLGPAVRQAALEIVEQAAAEIGAQLPGGRVEVTLSEGEPSLVYRNDEAEVTFSADDLEARMTVRLPSNLKSALEEAADSAGDSVNSFVLKTLATGTSGRRRGRRITETFET
jgi:hypothetical protein